MPGIIGSSAGKAMISAGTLRRLAQSMPKTPIRNDAKSVAAAIEKIWLCISKNLHECATAASSAEKASVFLGGMHAYANPSPAAAAKQASLNTKSAISNIYKPQI